jgi:hypothetical protein
LVGITEHAAIQIDPGHLVGNLERVDAPTGTHKLYLPGGLRSFAIRERLGLAVDDGPPLELILVLGDIYGADVGVRAYRKYTFPAATKLS